MNIDPLTVAGFGDEWSAFDQTGKPPEELQAEFDAYFSVFRWDLVGKESTGFDMGCGSGRWDRLLAPRVGHLHCIDPSKALEVARRKLADLRNVSFHSASVDDAAEHVGSQMDFGVSLGVLHHIPDTAAAIRNCVAMLKLGAPLLLYLYYRFDNRPPWFRQLWWVSDLVRRGVSRLPFGLRRSVSSIIAVLIYWPLARMARAIEDLGGDVTHLPLTSYRHLSFYAMRTDALDRFGTRLEQRFTRTEIEAMLRNAGCSDIRFSDKAPFWCVSAIREN